VPDLTVTQALAHMKGEGDLASRAQALGKEVGADAVLFGTVSRYVERVGGEYGAQHPAAVAFTLQLVSVASGKILWSGSFDRTQQALATNLFNWWQFWRAGPRWFTAQEFTRLGVERVLRDLAKRAG
jgi:DNA-binding IclR family transcriptional regulator